jgi:hypothetical protein
MANDLSARDVQLPQTQFFKGKSYRGFCPIGPWLTVLERNEFGKIDDLELQLDVNGTMRQRDSTANLVFKPAETISEPVHLRQRGERRCPPDRHTKRLRVTSTASSGAAASAAAIARASALEALHQGPAPPAELS